MSGTEVAVAGSTPLSPSVPGNLVVTIDPDVVVPAEPTCEGTHAFGDLCVSGFSQIRFVSDRVTEGVALEWWSNLVGADLLVEAYRDGDGELVGRAFLRSHIELETRGTCFPPFPAENLHGEIVLASLSTAETRAVVHLETDTASITIPF